jgi:hypothetical protein
MFYSRLEHSVSSQALNFSQFSHSLGFFGSSSPALSHFEQGEATLLHVFGVAGNLGPFIPNIENSGVFKSKKTRSIRSRTILPKINLL